MEPLTLALLIAAAFVAAFIDSIVGGGGVISLPALLAAGLPPHIALGTNKLAATGASGMAAARWGRAGHVQARRVATLFPLAALGSVAGALTVLALDPSYIRVLVLVVMAAMTVYVVARSGFGAEDRSEGRHTRHAILAAALVLAIGFYDGFLGPGTGSFFLFVLVGVAGLDFARAAGHGRVLNFASNLGALAIFAVRDQVDYRVGLPMFAAMLAGAYAGSHFGIKHGARWIKPLFVAITVTLMARLVLV